MKSVILNTDFFTKILALKLKNRNASIIKLMNIILNKVKLPEVNRVQEKSRAIKNVNMELLENKYLNINLNSIISSDLNNHIPKKDMLNNVFNNLFFNLNLIMEQKIYAF